MNEPKTSPKRELILSIGVDKPAAEIIAAAKARGVEVSRAYVALLKEKQSGAGSTAPRKRGRPAKNRADASSGAASKADYVRALGASVKPAEIVARAKKDGIDLTLAYVYNVRRETKRTDAKTSAAPRRGAAPAPKRAAASDAELALRQAATAVVLAHGLGRAHAILDDVVTKIRAAVGALAAARPFDA